MCKRFEPIYDDSSRQYTVYKYIKTDSHINEGFVELI